MSTPLLSVDHITIQFGGLRAIDDLSFSARAGEITALIGPNGAGKTTAFNCITGFYKPDSGAIILHPAEGRTQNLHQMPAHHIVSRAHVARTFQNIRLFPAMTVLENLLVAQHAQTMKADFFGLASFLRLPRHSKIEHAAVEQAQNWLRRIGLLEFANIPAANLPYGAQRLLEIARAMCTHPLLLCLDEPAAGLNAVESAALAELLQYIKREHCAILLIEHDMSVVMRISDHIVVLEHGSKIAEGDPASVRADKAVIAAYLGEEVA